MSAWEDYKNKLGTTRPWHMLDPSVARVEKEESNARMDICLSCPELLPITHQGKQCGCLMRAKTKLEGATCPLGKW